MSTGAHDDASDRKEKLQRGLTDEIQGLQIDGARPSVEHARRIAELEFEGESVVAAMFVSETVVVDEGSDTFSKGGTTTTGTVRTGATSSSVYTPPETQDGSSLRHCQQVHSSGWLRRRADVDHYLAD